MNWQEIGSIALAIVASAGGIGGIIVLAVKSSVNIIAERLEEKYSLKLEKELERYRSNLENKIYISKTKFDTEFSIYRELSRTFFDMVKNVGFLFPPGFTKRPADEIERKEYEHDLYAKALDSTVLAQDTLNANAPFIPEDFFKKYNELLGLCKMQISEFEDRDNILKFPPNEAGAIRKENYNRSRDIRKQFEQLNSEIRDYISKLDVME